MRGTDKIVATCNKTRDRSICPEDFVKTVTRPIPKNVCTKECEEHTTINIIARVDKISLRVLDRRIITTVKMNIGEEQFGFKRGRGT